MREQNIGIVEIGEMTQAISHYYQLGNYFPDLGRPVTNQFSDNFKNYLSSKKADKDYWKSEIVRCWNRIDFHMVDQTWGSTSCGWGGIGGAAMSNKFNMVIENRFIGLFFVYWDGKLAYIAKIKEGIDYGNISGLYECDEVYDIIYKHEVY